MKRVKIDWRAPQDCREWLSTQPGGMSATLERLVRGAMGQHATPLEIAQAAIIEELRRQLGQHTTPTPNAAQKPAQRVTEDDKWGGWDE